MDIDFARYREFVDDFDISEERKIELVQTVATIMASFVDRAFGTSPEQILLGTTDKLRAPKCDEPVESSLQDINQTFNQAAKEDASRKIETCTNRHPDQTNAKPQ